MNVTGNATSDRRIRSKLREPSLQLRTLWYPWEHSYRIQSKSESSTSHHTGTSITSYCSFRRVISHKQGLECVLPFKIEPGRIEGGEDGVADTVDLAGVSNSKAKFFDLLDP